MKIEKITVCNLNSIEGEQVVDFTQEPLRSAGLFAITGSTGAGKSTLLDAICLALYNRAPRLDDAERLAKDDMTRLTDKAQQAQAGHVCHMLRRGARQGGATVVFATHDGDRYEAAWQMRRTRGGNYATPERSLRKLAPYKEQVARTDIDSRIQHAIGLTYEQFTRTVILAQNSFANFLKAPKAEKALLLEKLTGTEVYGRISAQIHTLAAEADKEVEKLETSVKGILENCLPPEALTEHQERAHLLQATLQHTAQSMERNKEQVRWIAEWRRVTENLAHCETAYAEAQRNLTAMRHEEQQLERYDTLLDMQPTYQEIVMRQADMETLKNNEATLAAEMTKAEQTLTARKKNLEVARERTAEAEKQLETRRPTINRGHALTGELHVAQELLNTLEEQWRQATHKLDSRQNALRAKNEELQIALKQIEKLKLHRQSLSVHQLMFDKFDLVKDKLTVFRAEMQRNAESQTKLAELQRLQEESRHAAEKAQREMHDLQAQLDTRQGELMLHTTAIQGKELDALQRKASESRQRLSLLQRAQVLWQHISEGYALINTQTAAARRNEADVRMKRAESEKMQADLKVVQQTFDRVSTAYTLSQTENMVQLRKHLKEGTACPVCGAKHHPYHTETEQQLGNLLQSLTQEFTQAQEDLNRRTTQLQELLQQIAADEARIAANAEALAQLQRRQQADIEEWAQYAHLDSTFADCTATVNRDARRLTIEMLMESTGKVADEANRELEDYNVHQREINRLHDEINKLAAAMASNRTNVDNLQSDYRMAMHSAEEVKKVMTESSHSFAELYSDLGELITLSGWFTEWKNNPDGFRTRLTSMHYDWEQTLRQLDEAQRNVTLVNEEMKNASANVVEETRRVTQCRERRDAAREELQNKREELRRMFGALTPQQESERLQQLIDAARNAELKARQEYEKATGAVHTWQGEHDNLMRARELNLQAYREKMQQLDVMMLRFNSSHSPVQFAELQSLFSNGHDWKTLRATLDKLREYRLLAHNHLNRARAELLKLQAAPIRPGQAEGVPQGQPAEAVTNYDDIEQKLLDMQQQMDETTRRTQEELHAVMGALQTHERCEAQVKMLHQSLNAARDNALEWQRLDQLLGSADGKKFRTIAQSYTFAYLVEHANWHLRQLSPRYELHSVPDTLMLEIVDRDMLDEHRYVNSLSGGETFVVSLALALGLASLSGGNLSIGSLFIDEGFGNLDQSSLELVMTALSNLENTQGRKVGVISHTEQIRQQITPQIRLIKLPGSGASRIEIV